MPDYKITKVTAREVLDSRGNPTVEVVLVAGGICASAIVPSGASTGKHEAVELRDGGKRFLGKGVSQAVDNVNSKIAKAVMGRDCTRQQEIDRSMVELDGTPNKSVLGANAILGVSLAAARASSILAGVPLHKTIANLAASKKVALPTPFCNVINGGKHAGTSLKVQEFMIVPKASTFKEAITIVSETYHVLKGIIAKVHGKAATNVGDEGGFAPSLKSAEDALILLERAATEAGYKEKIRFAIDAAASEFYNKGSYEAEGGKSYTAHELVDYYMNLIDSFKIVSVEDPFDQEDFESFAELTKKAGIQIVGDDLLVTSISRLKTGIDKKSCNCLLLKVNQIGTLTESIAAAKLATQNKWGVMVSHRSGETEDAFIADLATGLGTGQLKAGAPARAERTAKYNQLIRLEEDFRIRFSCF